MTDLNVGDRVQITGPREGAATTPEASVIHSSEQKEVKP